MFFLTQSSWQSEQDLLAVTYLAKKNRDGKGEPETEVSVEWTRETDVLTKRGSREMKFLTTQLAVWKKKAAATTRSNWVWLLKKISKRMEMSHRSRVAKKKTPAFSFARFAIGIMS